MLRTLIAAAALFGVAASAHAAELQRIGPAQGLIASAVVAPAGATTLYISGITPTATNAGAPQGTTPVYGDTKTQAISIFKRMEDIAKQANFSLGDMAMLRVYLIADPAKGNKMDFAGFNEAYSQYFGTAAQPNKPARITMQITQLANPAFLVEIEGQAVKAP